jgi:hypothetical protein
MKSIRFELQSIPSHYFCLGLHSVPIIYWNDIDVNFVIVVAVTLPCARVTPPVVVDWDPGFYLQDQI